MITSGLYAITVYRMKALLLYVLAQMLSRGHYPRVVGEGGGAPVRGELLLRPLQRALRAAALSVRVARVAPRALQLL